MNLYFTNDIHSEISHLVRIKSEDSIVSHCGKVAYPLDEKGAILKSKAPSDTKVCKLCERWKSKKDFTAGQKSWMKWQRKKGKKYEEV